MRIITIDLNSDLIMGLSSQELKRLKEIVDASLPKKVDDNKLDFEMLMNYYNEVFSKSMRVVTDATKKNFNKRIKEGYTKFDIKKAIDNASNDKFHEPNNFKHVTLEFLSRPDIFQRYVSELIHQEARNIRLKRQQEGSIHTNY